MKLLEQVTSDVRRPEADDQQWQRDNEAYLGAALRLLRLRLAAFSDDKGRVAEASRGRNRWHAIFGSGSSAQVPGSRLDPAATPQEIRKAAEAVAEVEATDPPPALHILGDRFGLSPFERQVLFLCAAVEFDTRIGGLCAAAQHNEGRDYPTFALALALFDDPAWDVLSPLRPLRYWRLIDINQPGSKPLTTSALRANERVVNFIKGLNYLDDRLSPLLVPFEAVADATLPPSQEEAADKLDRAMRLNANGTAPLAQLVGQDSISKQMVALRVAQKLRLTLYRLPAAMLPREPGELESLALLWHRENLLMPIGVYLDAHDLDAGAVGAEPRSALIARFLARRGGVFFVSARETLTGIGAAMPSVSVAKPKPAEQGAAWKAALPEAEPQTTERLAGQFDLNVPAIRQIARAHAASDGSKAVWDACLDSTGTGMDRLAERLQPLATWDDIVLPEAEMAVLRQLSAQVARRAQVYDTWGFRGRMNRGLGISALFTGGSGTGKTMAAEVIANALRLHLYRIDLSAVVSKYIGETEKNLRQLFDAAEVGGAILFFDEADALFGKRSEVRDSHDRYANIETSYLLQRIESYRGLAILATNMRSALDNAFLRRLRFVVSFPYPGPVQRKAIWRRAWPKETPLAEFDYDRLARLNLAGGNIATVALNAAFMAAEQGGEVTMPLVLAAARTEYEKLERPIHEADFRWTAPLREVSA